MKEPIRGAALIYSKIKQHIIYVIEDPRCKLRGIHALSIFGLIDNELLSIYLARWTEISSTSKIRVLFGGILDPAPRLPYARFGGMNSCHFAPSFIICSALAQPSMTRFA